MNIPVGTTLKGEAIEHLPGRTTFVAPLDDGTIYITYLKREGDKQERTNVRISPEAAAATVVLLSALLERMPDVCQGAETPADDTTVPINHVTEETHANV
jgi:hypothetical protein